MLATFNTQAFQIQELPVVFIGRQSISIELLYVQYQRFGYAGLSNIEKVKSQVTRIKILDYNSNFQYPPYYKGKQIAKNINTRPPRAIRPLELVYIDLSGKVRLTIRNSYKLYIIFVDNFSRFTQVYIIVSKSTPVLLVIFSTQILQVERQSQYQLSSIRSNIKKAFNSYNFATQFREYSIRQLPIALYILSQNRVVERSYYTIQNTIRAIFIDSLLPLGLQYYLVYTVVYLKNLIPTTTLNRITPY